MKNFFKKLWRDESGQGMAEYVLLIVVVLGVAFLFRERITGMVRDKLGEVSSQFNSFQAN
jgi:Flp pilus assembly pilin Flp